MNLDLAADRIRQWKHDAIQFVRENFRVEPYKWQKKFLRAFTSADPLDQRIAMQACAGPGKSAALAWGALHFLTCQGEKNHHPVGYAISITGDNLRDNLWKEIAVWRGRSEFLSAAFEQTSEKIFARHHPDTWWIKARTWPKTANADAQGRVLSGLHSKYIGYFPDEVGDIPPPVLRAAEQGLSTGPKWGKIAGAGNPTSLEGMLYEMVTSGRFRVIRITGDPDDPDRSPNIDIDWARRMIAEYGRENPWVMSYVLGKFPPSSINALLGPDEVNEALGRGLHEEDYIHVQKRLGIDVARFGDNRTVLFPRQGLRGFMPAIMRNARGPQIAARVSIAKERWGSEAEFIDDTGGYAGSAIDACLIGGIPLIPVNMAGKASDPRFFNVRSEVNFRAAEWVKRGGCLPQGLTDHQFVREATATTYWYEKGKLRVEEKEQVKKKLNGQSPDIWDALTLTFAMADMPSEVQELVPWRTYGEREYQRGRLLAEYDPLDPSRL